MHLSVSLPAFVVAVLLISASPGPAMALILRRTALHGMRTAVPLVLGLEGKDVVLLSLTFLVSTITLASGRTNVMQGAVHLVLFAVFLVLTLVP